MKLPLSGWGDARALIALLLCAGATGVAIFCWRRREDGDILDRCAATDVESAVPDRYDYGGAFLIFARDRGGRMRGAGVACRRASMAANGPGGTRRAAIDVRVPDDAIMGAECRLA
jgi:hypothetical protein